MVTLPESEIDAYSKQEQFEFIEMPKRLYFETYQARDASCILPVQTGIDGLTGKGILVVYHHCLQSVSELLSPGI